MEYADIHTHVLACVDDGPENMEQMYALLDAIYNDGTKYICCTPHYHPGYYGYNQDSSEKVFHLLSEYAKKRYPDMSLFLGNELHYSRRCMEWLEDGLCRTINGTRFVLIDFNQDESYKVIEFAVYSFLRHGYVPVLAHIERYRELRKKYKLVKRLHDIGALIQVNASSVLRMGRYPIIKKILRLRIVDVIASDTHNLSSRAPVLSAAYADIIQKYGKTYADDIFINNPCSILNIKIKEKYNGE